MLKPYNGKWTHECVQFFGRTLLWLWVMVVLFKSDKKLRMLKCWGHSHRFMGPNNFERHLKMSTSKQIVKIKIDQIYIIRRLDLGKDIVARRQVGIKVILNSELSPCCAVSRDTFLQSFPTFAWRSYTSICRWWYFWINIISLKVQSYH